MTRRAVIAILLVALAATSVVHAEAPRISLRPEARPAAVLTAPALPTPPMTAIPGASVAAAPALPAPLRPQARPAGLEQQQALQQPAREETRAERRARERAERRAARPGGGGQVVQGGGLCGVPGLVGEPIGTVHGPGACGVEGAVRLTAVSGIRLSTPATLDCTTAKALKRWVDGALVPETARRGGVAELRVAASYACRGRNNQSGARLSEHGKGRAIDISGLTLRDGTSLTLLEDWGSGRDGRLLRSLHRAACGPFGTVLGPNADRFHRDHFHFDTARHRSGPYCR